MLLCEVAAGAKYCVWYNKVTLEGPPPGYHSVYAFGKLFGIFGDLNYREVVVYREEAINPSYVIVY